MPRNNSIVCHCSTCDEPDPHCEHGVNIAVTDCVHCATINAERMAEMRAALVAFYEDSAALYRSLMENMELMGRTVQYLDDAGVALEYSNKIKVN